MAGMKGILGAAVFLVGSLGVLGNAIDKTEYARDLYREAATSPSIKAPYKTGLVDEAKRAEKVDWMDIVPFSFCFSDRYDFDSFKRECIDKTGAIN